MRVLLASAPHADTFGYSMPPPGLLRLGGALRSAGIDVALEDLAFRVTEGTLPLDDRLADASAAWLVRGGAPEVLGLSVMGATLPIALAIAERVKRSSPSTWILIGGPGTTGVDAALIERFSAIDVVVRGEAEVTLPELLTRRGAALAGVRGVTWRGEHGLAVREHERPPIDDLAALPDYAWDLLPPIARYKELTGEAEGLVPIDSGRGCVYDCSFCTIGRFWGRRSRPLPAARLVDEVAALAHMPGARRAYMCHDLFGANRKHAVAFCERMLERDVRVPFEVRARVDHLDAELIALMGRAGCYRVLLGVESGDAEVRRLANKATADDLDVLGVVDACTAAGITPILSLILGLPGEDWRGLTKSLDLCADAALRGGVNLSLHLPNPQPGCALGEELGADARPVDGIPPDMAFGAGTTAAERALIAAHPDLFTTWALLPLPEKRLRDLHRLATSLPDVLMRYGRTFTALRRVRNEDALALCRTVDATGRSFEAFALAHSEHPLVADVFAWERAAVRAGARGAAPQARPASHAVLSAAPHTHRDELVPRAIADVFTARFDLDVLTRTLITGAPLPEPGEVRTHATVPASGVMPGVRTLKIGAGVATALEHVERALHEELTLGALRATRPGFTQTVERLVDAGLVALVPARRGGARAGIDAQE
ncbi:MAG: radical SAM protein [Planctomycetota bacterium]